MSNGMAQWGGGSVRGVSGEHLEDVGPRDAQSCCHLLTFLGDVVNSVSLGWARALLGLGRDERGRASRNTGTGKGNNLLRVIPGPVAEPGIKSRCAELVLGLCSCMWLH